MEENQISINFIGILTMAMFLFLQSIGDFHLAKRSLHLCLTYDGQYGAALNNLSVLAALSGNALQAKSYLNAAKEILQDTNDEINSNMEYMQKHYKL